MTPQIQLVRVAEACASGADIHQTFALETTKASLDNA